MIDHSSSSFLGEFTRTQKVLIMASNRRSDMSGDLIVKIEREAMLYIDEKRKAATPPMSIEALAKEVFPDVSNSRMIIQRMRKPQANGKTRSISFGEFVKMARALKISPLEAVGAVLNRVEETKL